MITRIIASLSRFTRKNTVDSLVGDLSATANRLITLAFDKEDEADTLRAKANVLLSDAWHADMHADRARGA